MQTTQQLQPILTDLVNRLHEMLTDHVKEIFLFGSYARNEAVAGSDIDILVLTDLSREIITQYTWKLGDLMAVLLLEYGIVVSPLIENQEYFKNHIDILPLFQNINNEGVKISA